MTRIYFGSSCLSFILPSCPPSSPFFIFQIENLQIFILKFRSMFWLVSGMQFGSDKLEVAIINIDTRRKCISNKFLYSNMFMIQGFSSYAVWHFLHFLCDVPCRIHFHWVICCAYVQTWICRVEADFLMKLSSAIIVWLSPKHCISAILIYSENLL